MMEKTKDKLMKESKNLEILKETLNLSNRQTKSMVAILSNFDEKLAKLEDTIGPVYEATGNLQHKQENINKTLQNLDFIIPFYSLANEMKPIITSWPENVPLNVYLEDIDKLKNAIKYFERNNPESPELMNVVSMPADCF